jgi:drug/metabolite transporter (DMT)-like permease
VPIQFLVQFAGLARTTASHAALMIGTLPMMVALAAIVVMHERPDRRGWLAIVASTLGVVLITFDTAGRGSSAGDGPTLIGDGLVLLSLTAAVAWVIMSKRLLHRYPPLLISIGVLWIGTILLLAWVLLTEGPPPVQLSPDTWLALVWTGLLGTSATIVLWNWGLSQVPASHAGVFANLEPVIGAILGVVVLHEALGHLALSGGLLIIGAALLMSIAPQSR